MTTSTLLIILLVVILVVGVFPRWNYSRSWGYGPSGILAVILVVLIFLLLMGKI